MSILGRFVKSITSWLAVPLLLLVIVLLAMDIPDRRPFLRGTARKAIDVVDAATRRARKALDDEERSPDNASSSLSETEVDSRSAVSSLPVDFRSQLERDVRDLGDGYYSNLWMQLHGASDPGSLKIEAVDLARRLPRRWWPVNGQLVHELDLTTVL